jgi:crossover junction endodeoxyribonuclease RusA
MIAEFVVTGTPRTPQTKKAASKQKWRDTVAEAAKGVKLSDIIDHEFSATILYFYTGSTELDVDGVGKLILDSVRGVLIEDDGLATQVVLRKTNQVGLQLTNPPPVLVDILGNEPSFVYVGIDGPPNHQEMPK